MKTPEESAKIAAVTRERDLYLLRELLDLDIVDCVFDDDKNRFGPNREKLTVREAHDFVDMLGKLDRYACLTSAGRRYVENVATRTGINMTPPSQRKPVPRGADVPLASVLRNLPKRPPGSRA
jgi:hypothetical protein